jgi:hypothetical protein
MDIKKSIDNIHRILGFMSYHLKSVMQQYYKKKTPRNVNNILDNNNLTTRVHEFI